MIKELLLVQVRLPVAAALDRLQPPGASKAEKAGRLYRAERLHQGFQPALNQFLVGQISDVLHC